MNENPTREFKKIAILIVFFFLILIPLVLAQSGRLNTLIALIFIFILIGLLIAIVFFDTSVRRLL